jgi:Na+-transporting methylmalonyl-CoA/oxaloacetate decarboxylase gamma subunit
VLEVLAILGMLFVIAILLGLLIFVGRITYEVINLDFGFGKEDKDNE